jgi:glycosyltransferase involved in cell wall biosynthesis
LNIALDATYSLGGNLSGVGVYSREMLEGLAGTHPEARFQFCYRPHRFLRSLRFPMPPNARRFLLRETRAPQSADIFHGLNQRLPRVPFRRAVTTFHDLFVITGEYSSPEFRQRFADQARDAAQRSDRIIAVSHFTAQQVINLLGIEPAKVRVVHHGVRPRAGAQACESRRERIILHVGAIQYRKNTSRLVDAFEKTARDWQLVLAGSHGFGATQILDRIARSPARERIRVLGYVPAAELEIWYARAMIFAFPSLDEGFGMPVLEAMAAGTPVIASRRSAVPEVAGDAAWLIDPDDPDELPNALVELTQNPAKRTELAAAGVSQASRFRWSDAVEKTWRVYRELLDNDPA